MSRVKTVAPSVERKASAVGYRNNSLRWNDDAEVAALSPCARDSCTAGAPTQLRWRGLVAPALLPHSVVRARCPWMQRIWFPGHHVSEGECYRYLQTFLTLIPRTWDSRKALSGI